MIRREISIGGWATLYEADSHVVADELVERHRPDAVITDPHYGIKLGNAGGGNRNPGGFQAASRAKTVLDRHGDRSPVKGADTPPNLALWARLADVSIFWGADHLRALLPSGGRFLAWDKTGGRGTFRDTFSDVELAWHSRQGSAAILHHTWKGAVRDKRGGEEVSRVHPMQKPIRIMQWCIDVAGLPRGATVLDPYMGSATTGIAAFTRGMKFVGCDIDPRWFDTARDRLLRQVSDGPLFEGDADGGLAFD